MRVFIIVLVLIFSIQSWTKADDIRDFEIEGMSIGDSALDYFSEEKILKSKRNYGYKSNEFYAVGFYENLKKYDSLDMHFKTGDKKYLIYSISGASFFEKNISDCYKKKNDLKSELASMFSDVEIKEFKKKEMKVDKFSTIESTYFLFSDGAYVKIQCYDWSEKLTKEKNWIDNLRIAIAFKEFRNWKRN
jgi:hypothetical protein